MAVDLRKIDVVAVSWPGAQAPAVTVQDVARAVEVEVAPRWREFTSVQQVPNDKTLTFQLGIVETRRIDLTAKMSCESLTFGTFITNIRDAFYSSLAIVDSKERYLIILSPDAQCIWSGRASVGKFSSKG